MFRRGGWGKESPSGADGNSGGGFVLGLKRGNSKPTNDKQEDVRLVSVNPPARRRTNELKDVHEAFQEEAGDLDDADLILAPQSTPHTPGSSTVFSNPAFRTKQPGRSAAGRKLGLSGRASGSEGEESEQVVAHATWGATGSRAYQSNEAIVSRWQGEFHREYNASPMTGVMLPAPQANQVQCYMRRNKSRLGGSTYCMYLQKGDMFLLSAKKRKTSAMSHFIITCSRDDLSKKSATCLAHLKANLSGTQYSLWAADPAAKGGNPTGKELGAIRFKQTALTVAGGPRNLTVILPQMEEAAGSSGETPVALPGGLHSCYEKAKKGELAAACLEKISCLKNCPPMWDEKIKRYTLDFRGRVKQASVKNAQLTMYDVREQQRGSSIALMFGKVNNDTFVLDFSFPLTPLQSFAIALAIMDSKLCYSV